MLMLFAALVCSDCHSDLVKRYNRTPMAQSSGSVVAASEHAGKVGARFRITDEMKLEWPGGTVDLSFYIGSRRMGRSYAYSRDGYLFQAPVGYYANRQAWDMAPGYEHDSKPYLNRPITAECLFCHATGATAAAGSMNRFSTIGHGIQCERCHGKSDEHEGLVNPAKLNPRARDSVCDQCHLSGAVRLNQPSKRLADFRPGQDLAEYVEVFVASSTRMKVNSHSDALAGSRCKQESGGKLWCGTCHNPHRPTASFNTICQNCHEKPHRTGDCTGCHMPKGKAYDGGHTVFTDHTLSVRPRPRALASYFGRDASPRNLGLAYIQLARDQRDTGYLDKAWPLLRLAVSSKPRDPELYFNIAVVLEADGREAQAAAYYRESLDQDPLQPEALNRLAALLGNTAEAKKLRQQSAAILPLPF